MHGIESPTRRVPAARILIVAADPVVAALLGLFVEREGHQPVYAARGPQAVLADAPTRPDLVLLAVADPADDDGVVEALLARAARSGAPVVWCREPSRPTPASIGLPQVALPLTRAGLARALASTYPGRGVPRARRQLSGAPWRSARVGAPAAQR